MLRHQCPFHAISSARNWSPPASRTGYAKFRCNLPDEVAVRAGNLQISTNLLKKQVTAEPTVRCSKKNSMVGTGYGHDGYKRQNLRRSDPKEGMDQILVWLAIDGLFLWQFMGIIHSDDPMIAEVGKSLRARIKATLEGDSGPSRAAPSPIDANCVVRSEA